MKKVEILIDGIKTKAQEGAYLLPVIRRLGIDIPSICSHPALEPSGSCRLCIVEIEKKNISGIVTSCNFPVKEGLEVRTSSEKIKKLRRLLIELLVSRCNESDEIKMLATKYGVANSRFEQLDEDCILCGLCFRVCSEVIGANAISFSGRGVEKSISSPFGKNSETCLGCGACSHVCPTGAIKKEDTEGRRDIRYLETSRPLAKCRVCSMPFAPAAQLEHIKKELKLPDDVLYTCSECKRSSYAEKIISFAKFHGG